MVHLHGYGHKPNPSNSTQSRQGYGHKPNPFDSTQRHQSKMETGKQDNKLVAFRKQLSTFGLTIRGIRGDGNCLFRAICDQLQGRPDNHMCLRKDVVDFMEQHREEFENFIDGDDTFEEHIRKLRLSGQYCGYDVLVAIARMFRLCVVIHQEGVMPMLVHGNNDGCQQVHLAYHRTGEHYSSVRYINDTMEAAANVRINFSDKTKKEGKAVKATPDVTDKDIENLSKITGCKDLSVIREALMESAGDQDDAIAYVKCLLLMDSAL